LHSIPGISPKGIWAITNGITNNRRRVDGIEFVDKKASKEITNAASVIRAVMQEHRAVSGLANPTEKISELKKDKERYDRLVLRYFVFLDRELDRKAEMKLSEEKNEEWERRKAFLMGERFNVVPLGNIKSHFVTIDSGVLYGIMTETSPEFDVRSTEITAETRETYWKNIFNFKGLKVSKKKEFTGLIESDGIPMCVHYLRLKKDRPVPPSASRSAKHEGNKQADPATQKMQENDFVVGADPGNTNIISIAVSKLADDGTDGNLRQKHMRLLRFSSARD